MPTLDREPRPNCGGLFILKVFMFGMVFGAWLKGAVPQ